MVPVRRLEDNSLTLSILPQPSEIVRKTQIIYPTLSCPGTWEQREGKGESDILKGHRFLPPRTCLLMLAALIVTGESPVSISLDHDSPGAQGFTQSSAAV